MFNEKIRNRYLGLPPQSVLRLPGIFISENLSAVKIHNYSRLSNFIRFGATKGFCSKAKSFIACNSIILEVSTTVVFAASNNIIVSDEGILKLRCLEHFFDLCEEN